MYNVLLHSEWEAHNACAVMVCSVANSARKEADSAKTCYHSWSQPADEPAVRPQGAVLPSQGEWQTGEL